MGEVNDSQTGFRQQIAGCDTSRPLPKTCTNRARNAPGKSCCTYEQVCGATSWEYHCSSSDLTRETFRAARGNKTEKVEGPRCIWARVSKTFVAFDTISSNNWLWLLSGVLILWLCVMFTEMQDTAMLFRSIMCLPAVGPSMPQVVIKDKRVAVVGLLPIMRLILLVVIVLPKFVINIAVACVGMSFLMWTQDLPDLVMNAVALAFVLEIDEMLFKAFCDFSRREMLENALPLRVGMSNVQRHAVRWTAFPAVAVVLIVAVVFFVIQAMYIAELAEITQIVEKVCRPEMR